MHRRDACATRTDGTGESDELACGEPCGCAAAVALGYGFEVLRIDGDVFLIVLMGFEDGDERFEREALVDREDEILAVGCEAFEGFDAFLNRWAVEPLGEGVEGGVEAVRDLTRGLLEIGEGFEDVGGGFSGGVELDELGCGGDGGR